LLGRLSRIVVEHQAQQFPYGWHGRTECDFDYGLLPVGCRCKTWLPRELGCRLKRFWAPPEYQGKWTWTQGYGGTPYVLSVLVDPDAAVVPAADRDYACPLGGLRADAIPAPDIWDTFRSTFTDVDRPHFAGRMIVWLWSCVTLPDPGEQQVVISQGWSRWWR
jgi:hypothetical protein